MFSGDFQAIDQNVSCWLVDLIFNVPVKQLFSHVGTEPPLPGYNWYFRKKMCLAQGQNM